MDLIQMNTTRSSANYKLIIPISISCALISIILSFGILILIYLTRQFHTITYLLICNTCLSSIYYSLVQSINYLYLIYFSWNNGDVSCRFRAYFAYMSITAIVYSYFLQALSRFFFSISHIKYRWLLSFKIHYLILLIQWIIVIIVPLPALITKDIYYRPTFLCWVPKHKILHVLYTLLVYYLIPVIFIISIYVNIYIRVKTSQKTHFKSIQKIKEQQNLEILINILILIGIYIFGGIPTLIYLTTQIEIFYSIGIISLSLFVMIERIFTILLDRKIRNIIKNYFTQSINKITPMFINHYY